MKKQIQLTVKGAEAFISTIKPLPRDPSDSQSVVQLAQHTQKWRLGSGTEARLDVERYKEKKHGLRPSKQNHE